MEEELARKFRIRAILRQSTTKLLQKIDRCLAEETSKLECEEFIAFLEERSTDLKNLDHEILMSVAVEEIDKELEQASEYRQEICRRKVSLTDRLRTIEKKYLNFDQPPIEKKEAIPKCCEYSRINLPRIQIPRFYGDSSKWLDFFNQFRVSVHENDRISKTEKFVYLKSLLGGNALAAITGFAISEKNYDAAIDIVNERFGRSDIVVSSHMNKLLAIEPVKSLSNFMGLRRLYDQCVVQVRSLESLNVTAGSYGNLLCPIVLQKLPEELNIKYHYNRKAQFDVKELLEFIRKEVECREAASLICQQNFGGTPRGMKIGPRFPTSAALSASVVGCIFCGGSDHSNFGCSHLDAQRKRDILKRTGRCFLCFGKRHLAFECRRGISCRSCLGKHHESVCFRDGTPPLSREIARFPDNSVEISVAGKPTAAFEIRQNKSHEISSDVVLQTVYTVAKNTRTGRNRLIGCPLDGGSQITTVKEDTSKGLQLPVNEGMGSNIHTFEEREPRVTKSEKVGTRLRNVGDPITFAELEAIEAFAITTAEKGKPNTVRRDLKDMGAGPLATSGSRGLRCTALRTEPPTAVRSQGLGCIVPEQPGDISLEWKRWCKRLINLESIRVPKWLVAVPGPGNAEMHCFCDANIYLTAPADRSGLSSHLVIDKSRVAPLQKLTLPRLELMAAEIGIGVIGSIHHQFSGAGVVFWTDYTITLHWIRGRPQKGKLLVVNSVEEIRGKTETGHGSHCPGPEDPTEELTRGTYAEDILREPVVVQGSNLEPDRHSGINI